MSVELTADDNTFGEGFLRTRLLLTGAEIVVGGAVRRKEGS